MFHMGQYEVRAAPLTIREAWPFFYFGPHLPFQAFINFSYTRLRARENVLGAHPCM